MGSLLSNVRPSIRRRAPSGALLGLIVVLAIGLSGPVQAQSPGPAPSGPEATESAQAQWKPHFDEQIARALRDSSSGRMRTTLLQTLIDVAVTEGAAMDFSAAVPALLRVIEHDPSPPVRRAVASMLSDVSAEAPAS